LPVLLLYVLCNCCHSTFLKYKTISCLSPNHHLSSLTSCSSTSRLHLLSTLAHTILRFLRVASCTTHTYIQGKPLNLIPKEKPCFIPVVLQYVQHTHVRGVRSYQFRDEQSFHPHGGSRTRRFINSTDKTEEHYRSIDFSMRSQVT
jgi:hypothetical protein